MRCFYCKSKRLWVLEKTKFGYEQRKCKDCLRKFNERTGTPFNYIHCRTEIIFLAIYYYIRINKSLRQVSEMLLERGVDVSYEDIRDWVNKFAPMLTQYLKKNPAQEIEKNLVC